MGESDQSDDCGFLPAREFASKMRRQPTPAERALWEIVNRPEFREWRFRKQLSISSYFIDVAATSIKLAIEADGDSHDDPEHDEARDRALAEEKWLVLRFRNEQIIDRPDHVAEAILNACIGRKRFRY